MKTTTKKKHPPSPKLLAHLKRLNLSRRKKAKGKPTKPAKAAKKAATRKKPKAKPAPAPAPKPAVAPVVAPIPPVELPKGDAPGQTTMPVVETAVAASQKPPGEELL